MRGLGKGQTIDVLVIDEVKELILESFRSEEKAAGATKLQKGSLASDRWATADVGAKLEDILAWLLLNSMRSEHLQHMQLCQQVRV